MNFFTKPMKLMTAVVLKADSDKVSESLLRAGAMDFIDIRDLDDFKTEGGHDGKSSVFEPSSHGDAVQRKVDDLIRQLQGIYAQGMMMPPRMRGQDIRSRDGFSVDQAAGRISSISGEFMEAKQVQKAANVRFQSFEELDSYLKSGKTGYIDIRAGRFSRNVENPEGKFTDAVIGIFPLAGALSAGLAQSSRGDVSPDEAGGKGVSGEGVRGEDGIGFDGMSVAVALKRDSGRINPMMAKLGWIESDDVAVQRQAKAAAPLLIARRTAALGAEVDELKAQADRLLMAYKDELDGIYIQLNVMKLCARIKDSFHNTKNTAIFSGWVPADQAKSIEAAIRAVSNGQCIVEWTAAAEVKGVPVPVEMDSPKALAPFSRIVSNYSTPEYGAVNPVFFTTAAFMCMFGLMFADVGQGLVLLLIGLLGSLAYKRNPLKKEGLITSNLCHLLVFLGISSMAFGALFGSYFGFSWLPPLWFNYHHVVEGEGGNGIINDIYDILGITIRFGFIVIVTGLALNWINLARKRQWVTLVMDKYGLLGGWMYIIGFWGASYFVGSGYKSFPPGSFFIIALLVPAVLMLLRGPMEALAEHAPFKLDIMDWIVNLLEVFSGYLSNTLSFMRVAGLGIAHVSLMAAFQSMAGMTSNPVFYFIIIALGNALVIAIEGLSAGIQALRLNYYEFFTKFFTGKGVAYKPVNMEEAE